MGGAVTGPILELSDIGILLFLLALPLTFWSRKLIAGLVTLLIWSDLSIPFEVLTV